MNFIFNLRKKTIITFFTLLIFSSKKAFSNESKSIQDCINYQEQIDLTKQNLEIIKQSMVSKMVIRSGLIATILFAGKKELYKSITKCPLCLAVSSMLILKFGLDVKKEYKKITHTVLIFELAQEINRYILYGIAIKNKMEKIDNKFNSTNHFNQITTGTGFEFKEIEKIIEDQINQGLHQIKKLRIKIRSKKQNLSYDLCKENLTIEIVITTFASDKKDKNLLIKFSKNPTEHYNTLVLYLNSLIKEKIKFMIKQLKV